MKYISTRGQSPALAFDEVLLAGLAPDGGLYLPETWPHFTPEEIGALGGRAYPDVVLEVARRFVGESIPEAELADLVRASYANFGHAAVAPLRQLESGIWLLELIHGPTLAFKDYALQLLGRLFDHVLQRRGARATIVAATSGDTGSAAIEAFRDRRAVDIVVLHPKGRISEVQRRQMTTVTAANVHNVAVEGSFDDCQDLVKALFADSRFRQEMQLSAVNSINWARIMAQIAYYMAAGAALGAPERELAFAVPTGNFGNVYAGYAAARLGLPVARLIVCSNRNDILTRFLESGVMEIAEVEPSLSPSMDIQISSNFERLLLDLLQGDNVGVARTMAAFRDSGRFAVRPAVLEAARARFGGFRRSDEETLAEIRRTWQESAVLLDPHSAIGVAGARAYRDRLQGDAARVPVVALATAHPAKFPEAAERAVGIRPALPERLADLYEREERCATLANDVSALKDFVRERSRQAAIAVSGSPA